MNPADADRDALWQAVLDTMIPWDEQEDLLAFAELLPDDPGWRAYVRAALRLDAPRDYMPGFLNIITLFPDSGAFAVPEILALTRHPDPYIRQWATQDLRLMASERPDLFDPREWVEVVRPLLQDEYDKVREEAGFILEIARERNERDKYRS